MSVSFGWNVRGFNNRIKRRKFKNWLNDVKPLFGSVSETRVTRDNFDCIIKEFQGWNVISNYEYADLGRLWIFWRPSIDLQVISKSAQAITCLIKQGNREQVVFSFIYASNCRYARLELWDELCLLQQRTYQNLQPWVVLGDFNQTLYPHESSSGGTRVSGGMMEFRDFIDKVGLSDLPYQGPKFTWWNNQEANPLAKKLDRVLVNDLWLLSLPQSYSTFGPMDFSDHASALVHFGQKEHTKKAFKFANHLLTHPKLKDTVSNYWESTHFAGSSMFVLAKKLRLLKRELKTFSYNHFSNLELRVREAHSKLLSSQEAFVSNPTQLNARLQKRNHNKWWFLSCAEDKFLEQRARIKWIQAGDKNTKFFHKVVQGRKAANQIHYLMHNGSKLEDKFVMQNVSVEYFSSILGMALSPLADVDRQTIHRCTEFKCDPSLKDFLVSTVTEDEIKREVFSLPRNKCPGPDGYNAEFFIHNWSILGDDVIRAIKEFFDNGQMLKELNSTAIVLIPKVSGADSLSKFRPISLCNVIYKVISKIIARRLQLVLPGIISPTQSGFVRGRHLVENVNLATEFVKGFGTKSCQRRGAIKIDLTKAFDTVRWDFIIHILTAAEFPERFIEWIKECITTTSFSVCLNGELCGYFEGKRGLRQGDPLSPSLFIIGMEVFSSILKKAFEDGSISYHDLGRDPKITHLSFADDVMVFFDGKIESLRGIKRVFEVFKSLSGLTLNLNKTTLYHSGLSEAEEIQVKAMGFQTGSLPVRYLGLPLLTRRMTRSDYSPLLDSIHKRLSSWTVRSLSFAGRLLLIKSIIYSLLNFWMGAFLLPKGCLRDITKICSKFLWAGDLTKKSTPKVSWKTICLPKEEGGLGLRDLFSWNVVLSLKLIWWIFTKKESLWVTWVKRHWLRKHIFWTAPMTSQSSWVWRTLLSLRHLAKRMLSCRIYNGQQASFWYDSWHPWGPLIDRLGEDGPRRTGIQIDSNVAGSLVNNQWRLPAERTRCQAMSELRDSLLSIRAPVQRDRNDRYFWGEGPAKSSHFSTTITWEALRRRSDRKAWAPIVWSKASIPKHSFTFWIITLDRLPLMSRLLSWGLDVIDNCCLCNQESETRDHLFLHCRYATQIWKWLEQKLHCTCSFRTWNGLLTWMGACTAANQKILRITTAQAIAYAIWKERNTRIHQGQCSTEEATLRMVDKSVRIYLLATIGRKHHRQLLSLWYMYG